MLCSPLSALQHVSLMKEKGISFSQNQTTNAAGQCRGEDEAWVQCNGLPYHYRRREMLVKQKEDHSTERLI